MTTVGLFEAKYRLSALVERAARAEEIIITCRGEQVARLVPAPTSDTAEAAGWVNDAPVTMPWLLPDEATPFTERMLGVLGQRVLWAPPPRNRGAGAEYGTGPRQLSPSLLQAFGKANAL